MNTPLFATPSTKTPQSASVSRRQWLQSMALASAATPWWSSFAATQPLASARESAFVRAAAGVQGALSTTPGVGFDGTLATPRIPLRGRLPAGLRGTLYRNGPARFNLGKTHYNHWFDGDGMVQAFHFADGQVSHKGVLLRTPKMQEEEAAGRFLYSNFGTEIPDSRPLRSPDAAVNTANISMLSMNGGGELYALWEAGSAMQLDPQTLAVKGFKAWSPETTGASFSAHPRCSPDGTVWNFGYTAGSGKLIIYEIAAEGTLKRQALIDAPQADMVHDFAVTQNYLVFLLMPLAKKPHSGHVGSLNRYEWHSNAPLIAMLVNKADFSTQRIELPNGGVFHIGNAWEEGGLVRLGYARYGKFLEHLRGLTLPMPQAEPDQLATWMQVEINPAKGTTDQTGTGLAGVEFPSFDTRHTGERTGLTVLMQNTHAEKDASYGMDSVLALRGDKLQRYTYSPEWLAEEHIYVPAPGTADDTQGWIVGTAFNGRRNKTTLSVFEANHLAKGPMAQLDLPYALPLGLHGKFVAAKG